jgi:hypothetical protein
MIDGSRSASRAGSVTTAIRPRATPAATRLSVSSAAPRAPRSSPTIRTVVASGGGVRSADGSEISMRPAPGPGRSASRAGYPRRSATFTASSATAALPDRSVTVSTGSGNMSTTTASGAGRGAAREAAMIRPASRRTTAW